MKNVVLAALLVVAVIAVLGHAKPAPEPSEDLDTAASHHGTGYVKIKVYRGPGDHDAPFGYWVKQPHDDHRHGGGN